MRMIKFNTVHAWVMQIHQFRYSCYEPCERTGCPKLDINCSESCLVIHQYCSDDRWGSFIPEKADALMQEVSNEYPTST